MWSSSSRQAGLTISLFTERNLMRKDASCLGKQHPQTGACRHKARSVLQVVKPVSTFLLRGGEEVPMRLCSAPIGGADEPKGAPRVRAYS